jgi:hypothetical protein
MKMFLRRITNVKRSSLPGHIMNASGALNTGLAHLVNFNPSCRAVATFKDGQLSVMNIAP